MEPGPDGVVLTHGASSNARAPLLVALAEAFSATGLTVARYDLPFRQARPHTKNRRHVLYRRIS